MLLAFPGKTEARLVSTFRISSDLSDDSRHHDRRRGAFEAWRFDALSDDATEAVYITFYDSYPFSPRYLVNSLRPKQAEENYRSPAVCFTYWKNGRTIVSTVNSYSVHEFSTSGTIAVQIGGNSLQVETADYGSGFMIDLQLVTARRRKVRAQFEWLSIESDLLRVSHDDATSGAKWNIVAPRADVSGRVTISAPGPGTREWHFRGTGYHDHLQTAGTLNSVLSRRISARAHFTARTAIFQLIHEGTDLRDCTVMLIEGTSVQEVSAQAKIYETHRNRFGVDVPTRLSLALENGTTLDLAGANRIKTSFFQTMSIADATLTCPDGEVCRSVAFIEQTDVQRLRNPLIRWLSDVGLARNGRAPYN
jgi:hypothetical protein